MASSRSLGRIIQLRDLQTGEVIGQLRGHKTPIGAVAFSPDGRLLASGAGAIVGRQNMAFIDNAIRIWDTENGKQLATFDGETGQVTCVVFSPDGATVAAGNHFGTVRVWELASGREILRFDGDGRRVNAICYSPDGTLIASGMSYANAMIWSLNPTEGTKPQVEWSQDQLQQAWNDLGSEDAPKAYRRVGR